MHLADGVVSAPVWIAGGIGAMAGIGIGLNRLRDAEIPQTALLTAAFFVASLIHVRTGFSSTHLVLNGLLGILLGWAAFPAIGIALLLQCLFFGHGGLTTLGLNTFNMALPAVLCWYLFARGRPRISYGVAAGALAVLLSACMVAFSLTATDVAFSIIARATILLQLPIVIIEGIVTGAALLFIGRVRPELLLAPASARG